MPDPQTSKLPLIASSAAAFALVGGLISFAGWTADIYRLKDWAASGIAVKANAALAISVAGTALLLAVLYPPARRLPRVLGLFVAMIGGMTLIEHLTGWTLGLDTLLFDEAPGAMATVAPGRMGPPAAASLVGIGTALMLMSGGARARAFSVALGMGALAIALLSLTGYLYGAIAMYAIAHLTGIAPQTATMILALGIGLVAASPDRQPVRTLIEDSDAGILARRLAPIILLIPLGLGWLRVEGEKLGFYDSAFGSAMRSILEVAFLGGILWWSIQALRVRDIQRNRAQQELRDSERRLTRTLENIADGFVTIDSDWRFTYVNPEAERILKKSRAELVGKKVWGLFPEAIGSGLYSGLHRAAAERTTVEIEGAGLAGDGRHFAVRIYHAAADGLSFYFQDITQRKHAEQLLAEADRRKDAFLATLAHELRNPLAPVRNAARILLSNELTPSKIKWAAEMINRQVQHMARLLEDLLDISRISRNRLELRTERVELAAVIDVALEASRPLIDAAGHAFTSVLPPSPIFVDGDTVRLAQVFSNLLNNAAKYTEPPGHIRLTLNSEGADVVIRIRDNGIGIEASMLQRIFDMFAQATPATHRSQGGLGIGLSLAKGLVELHGGQIEARSAGLGRGSEFLVRLPRMRSFEAPSLSQELAFEASPIARRVLVVDDLTDNADSLALLLTTLGHEVHTVYDGSAAIKAADDVQPDLIFLDIGMPGIDGLEACRRIRAKTTSRRPRIVALTGWGQPEDRRRTAEAGFDHHLIKPADPSEVVRLMNGLS